MPSLTKPDNKSPNNLEMLSYTPFIAWRRDNIETIDELHLPNQRFFIEECIVKNDDIYLNIINLRFLISL